MNTADLENPIFTDETAAREHFERVRWPNAARSAPTAARRIGS